MEKDISQYVFDCVTPEVMGNKPDLMAFLDVADRMNMSNQNTVFGVKSIISSLKSKNKYKRWHTV